MRLDAGYFSGAELSEAERDAVLADGGRLLSS